MTLKSRVSHERLRTLLKYVKSTGSLTWRVSPSGNVRVGDPAGTVTRGYLQVCVDGRIYMGHRLIFFYVTGRWPFKGYDIDHKNGNKSDNRWKNLREVTKSTNQENRQRAQTNNKTGYLGVSAKHGKFRAVIQLKGVQVSLGMYDTPELASAAYVEAKRKIHAGNTL